MNSVFGTRETSTVNELFVYTLLLHHQKEFEYKRAKTICLLVYRWFNRRVTVAQVQRARKKVYEERKQKRMFEQLELIGLINSSKSVVSEAPPVEVREVGVQSFEVE